MAAVAPSSPLIIVGSGRVGSALLQMGSGLPHLVIKSRSQHVGEALAAAGPAAADAPILVATTNDALPKARSQWVQLWGDHDADLLSTAQHILPALCRLRRRSLPSARPPAAPTLCLRKTACCCRCWSSTGWRATQPRCCTSAQRQMAATPMAARRSCAAGAARERESFGWLPPVAAAEAERLRGSRALLLLSNTSTCAMDESPCMASRPAQVGGCRGGAAAPRRRAVPGGGARRVPGPHDREAAV